MSSTPVWKNGICLHSGYRKEWLKNLPAIGNLLPQGSVHPYLRHYGLPIRTNHSAMYPGSGSESWQRGRRSASSSISMTGMDASWERCLLSLPNVLHAERPWMWALRRSQRAWHGGTGSTPMGSLRRTRNVTSLQSRKRRRRRSVYGRMITRSHRGSSGEEHADGAHIQAAMKKLEKRYRGAI